MGKIGARREFSWGTKELLFVFLATALIGYTAIGSIRELRTVYGDNSHTFPSLHSTNNKKKTGSLSSKRGDSQTGEGGGDTIHTLCTTNGSPYQNYQMRIAYATYEMIQKMSGGDRHKAFTRILHRTPRDPDPLADEIQTFRADPLQPECDDWCEYPVSDRANAVKQFWEYAKKNKMLNEDWYYMIESDYVFMKPLEIPKSPKNDEAYGYFFHYIDPTAHPHEMAVLYPGGDATSVAHSGPAPVLMSLDNWIKVTEDWETMAALIESKADIKERLGWVREMYGFSIAMAKNGIKFITEQGEENRFISEPPGMDTLGNAHAFHYTLATIFKTLDDKDVWGYDKRFHVDPSEVINVPKITPLPPFKEGEWKFIEGNPVTREKYDCINMMIARMNNAIDTLKPLHTKG